MGTDRIYYLDAMRGILMTLGVVVHSGLVFSNEQAWLIYSNQTSDLTTYLVKAIYTFRMPVFFIVSGYFCLCSIKRYGPNSFLNLKLKRLAVPLFATGLTLNSIQAIMLSETGWLTFNIQQHFLDGGWISHLWFLNNLIVYFTGTYLIYVTLGSPLKMINNATIDKLRQIPFWSILLVMPFLWISFKILGKVGFPLYADVLGIIQMSSLLKYLPYFLFGAWLFQNQNELSRFTNINHWVSITVIAASLVGISLLGEPVQPIELIIREYLSTVMVWFAASLCFYLFIKYANTYSRFLAFLSDASYSVYLFHHVIVIGLGLLMIRFGVGGFFGSIILIVITFALTLLIHHFIVSRIPIVRHLFNGK